MVQRAIEDVVEQRVSDARWASVLAWSRVGASFVTANPTTNFRSLRIERALDAASRQLLRPVQRKRSQGQVESVLHVLSEGPSTGGHLRFALRWVDADSGRSSSFATTRSDQVMPELADVAATRSGRSVVLAGSFVDRAQQLRDLAVGFDVVVCHTHNDDVIPCLAFGGDYRGAPVILMNHADHIFNLSSGNVSVVSSMRWTGEDFARRVRSFPADMTFVLPIPLTGVGRRMSREEAKRHLGISQERVVALTLARPTKYQSSGLHTGFVDVVTPALVECEAMLVAVGPSADEEPWTSAATVLGSRLRVEGVQSDPRVYLDAADIYLDSTPFASATSMLEAASRATPILTYRPHQGLQRLHSSEGILDQAVLSAGNLDDYRGELRRLIDDGSHRRVHGDRAAEVAEARHDQPGWCRTLEGLYSQAMGAVPITDRTSLVASADADEIRDYAVSLAGMESLVPLLWPMLAAIGGDFTQPPFDHRDCRSVTARTALARSVAKVRRRDWSGPDFAALLVPGLRSGSLRT